MSWLQTSSKLLLGHEIKKCTICIFIILQSYSWSMFFGLYPPNRNKIRLMGINLLTVFSL